MTYLPKWYSRMLTLICNEETIELKQNCLKLCCHLPCFSTIWFHMSHFISIEWNPGRNMPIPGKSLQDPKRYFIFLFKVFIQDQKLQFGKLNQTSLSFILFSGARGERWKNLMGQEKDSHLPFTILGKIGLTLGKCICYISN